MTFQSFCKSMQVFEEEQVLTTTGMMEFRGSIATDLADLFPTTAVEPQEPQQAPAVAAPNPMRSEQSSEEQQEIKRLRQKLITAKKDVKYLARKNEEEKARTKLAEEQAAKSVAAEVVKKGSKRKVNMFCLYPAMTADRPTLSPPFSGTPIYWTKDDSSSDEGCQKGKIMCKPPKSMMPTVLLLCTKLVLLVLHSLQAKQAATKQSGDENTAEPTSEGDKVLA